MSHWNYRIVKRLQGYYGLHEVFYDDDGLPWAMTMDPVDFIVDKDETPADLIRCMEMALHDAKTHEVLEEPEKWPGKDPG
jgi:hypothetical protein